MDGAGAGGAARERRKQLTAAEAVNHKRQLAQMVERELALTGADSVTDFDDALQMVLVETAFGRYPKHLLDVYTGKVVGRQERGDVVQSWQPKSSESATWVRQSGSGRHVGLKAIVGCPLGDIMAALDSYSP